MEIGARCLCVCLGVYHREAVHVVYEVHAQFIEDSQVKMCYSSSTCSASFQPVPATIPGIVSGEPDLDLRQLSAKQRVGTNECLYR